MKKSINRLTAIILLLCLMLSLAVPVTFAENVADSTVEAEKSINGSVYNFDLIALMDGKLTESKYTVTQAKADMQSLWSSGKINWCWENACEYLSTVEGSDKILFYKDTGLRVNNQADSWSAYRIKSPGKGTFTLTLEHSLRYDSGTVAVYILPADTEDVEKAMDPKNRVGKVEMQNDGNSSKTEKAVTSFVGYWDFEADKEYLVVLEAYETSPYKSSTCNIDVSKLIAEQGKINYETTEKERTVKPVTITTQAIPAGDPLHKAVVTEIYGHDYFFLPMEGGVSLVYDLDTGELVDTIHTGYSRTLDMRMDKDGIIWICGASRHIVRYDPYTQQTHKTPSFLDTEGLLGAGADSICPTPDGKLWFATYGAGSFGYYDYDTNKYTVLETYILGKYADRVTGLLYHDGYLFLNVNNSDGRFIVKYDIEAQKMVAVSDDLTPLMGKVKYFNNTSLLGDGDMIVCGSTSTLNEFIAINPETMELITDHGLLAGMNQGASEVIDGKQYLVCAGLGLYEYDIETKKFSKVPDAASVNIGFKSTTNSLVTLDGERYLFTYASSGGNPRMFNLETKEYKTWDSLVRHAIGAANIQSLTPGEEGDDRIYIGGYNTSQYAIYDESEGKIVNYIESGGQGDSGLWYKGIFYTGNYSSTTINEIPVEQAMPYPAKNEIIQRVKLDHDETNQKRIHTLAAGDGYVFAGTIVDSGYFGGAIVVYNTENGRWYYDRTATPDLVVTKVAYANKVLYAATSTEGGDNPTKNKPEGVSAVIVAYDYENKKLLGTLDPREYIEDVPEVIDFISGLEVDPVVEGRLWAVLSETLFCFTFDKETGKFDVQEVLSFDKTKFVTSTSRSWWNRAILFDTERNCLYFSFDTNGGFRSVEIEDWNAPVGQVKVASTNLLMNETPVHYTMGHDGDIYYNTSSTLKMLPLNITDEDWAIADTVDKMIASLGEITLQSEGAVKEARSAYENLGWRHKALIQNLELLKEAEADLLECMIDAIVIDRVDADSLPDLQVYMDTYKGFTIRYQNYLKKYDLLQKAYNKASALNNERVAGVLQKRIDELKGKFPLTLDDEPEVKAIRADFDAFTAAQRKLIDLTNQEEAEAQIKVLRAELINQAEALIQAIPDVITLAAEPAIEAARELVDKLYSNEYKYISYAKFDKADSELRPLKKAVTEAENVDAMIDAIGIVTLGDKNRIAEARAAYNNLNETGLSVVTKEEKLVRAEATLKVLQTWGIPVITVGNAAIVFAVLWFIPSLRSKVFKTKKKEETDVVDNV